MKPWTGWVIVERANGRPVMGSVEDTPMLYRTAAVARAALRLDLGVGEDTHHVVRVTLGATPTTHSCQASAAMPCNTWCGKLECKRT